MDFFIKYRHPASNHQQGQNGDIIVIVTIISEGQGDIIVVIRFTIISEGKGAAFSKVVLTFWDRGGCGEKSSDLFKFLAL